MNTDKNPFGICVYPCSSVARFFLTPLPGRVTEPDGTAAPNAQVDVKHMQK